jgi:hypothetical protein
LSLVDPDDTIPPSADDTLPPDCLASTIPPAQPGTALDPDVDRSVQTIRQATFFPTVDFNGFSSDDLDD